MFMQPTYRALVAEPVVGTGRLGGSSYRHSVSISSHDEQGCPPLHYKAKVVSLACLTHRCVVDSGRRTRDLRVRHDRHATETLFRLRALVVWCWSAPFWWGTKTPSGVTLGMFFFLPNEAELHQRCSQGVVGRAERDAQLLKCGERRARYKRCGETMPQTNHLSCAKIGAVMFAFLPISAIYIFILNLRPTTGFYT